MGEGATQVREEIDHTRAEMGGTIDTIADRSSPSRIMDRQRRRVLDRVHALRERVMGTAEDARTSLQQTTGTATDMGREMPEKVRSQAQGNPMAAGIVAFGSGLLAASILPPSQTERQAASRLREQVQPVLGEVKQSSQQVAHDVKSTAQEAVTEVRGTASQSAQHVVEEAKDSAQHVQQQAKTTGQDVVHQAAGMANQARSEA